VLTKLGVKLEPTQEQRATFKRNFRRLDNDGNQRLTAEEFGRDKFVTQDSREASFAAAFGARRVLKENDYLNSRVVGAEAERVFGALDANSNGSVSRGEFMANCELANEGLASEIFVALDTDRDKSMQIAEHVTVFGEWAGAHKAPPTQHENVKYGPYDRNVFDIWLPDSKEPSALILYIHGGGFVGGSKDGAWWSANVQKALDHGVAFASIQYRFRFEDQDETMSDPQRAGIQHILRDSARAIQYIRAHAKEYNLDKPRIACFGGSAGAGTSIWLAFHEDLADPDSPDPVLRESTRIAAAGMLAGQFTYDISRWDEAFKSRSGDIMATHGNGKKRPEFWKFFALSEEQYNGAQGEKWRADVDMQGLITAGDPPIFALTQGPDQAPLDRGIYNHHPYHALLIEQSCLAEGVEVLCLVPQVRKKDATRLKERPDIMMEFFFDKLGVSR
jgi:Ca2+-binding EF-hand superfamily protein